MKNWNLIDRIKWDEIRCVIDCINKEYAIQYYYGDLVKMGVILDSSKMHLENYLSTLGGLMTDWNNTAFGGMAFGL